MPRRFTNPTSPALFIAMFTVVAILTCIAWRLAVALRPGKGRVAMSIQIVRERNQAYKRDDGSGE